MSTGWRDDADLAIKAIGLLVALFGIFQYFSNNIDARHLAARQASLQYVANYGSPELRAHRQRLSEFWIRNADALIWMQENGASPKDYKSFLLSAFENDKHSRALLDSIFATTDFYDQLYLCQSTGVCDANVVASHFCVSAGTFNRRYNPIFAQLAILSGKPDFANGVKEISRQC